MTAIPARADQFKKFVYRSITYPLVMLALFAVILSWRVLVLMEAAHSVDTSDKVIAQAHYTLNLALDEETDERGYLVNGNPNYLQKSEAAPRLITLAFEKLRLLVAHNPEQSRKVRQIYAQYQLWQSETTHTLNVSGYPVNNRQYFDQGQENALMDTLQSDFASFIDRENELRSDRSETAERATVDTVVASAILAVIFGLSLGLVWVRQAQQFADHYEQVLNVSQRNLSLLSATLMSIGDAVLVTDVRGKIVQMNDVAERLTGWKFSDAYRMDADQVFRIVDKSTRAILISPIDRVLKKGEEAGISDEAILIAQSGVELSIEDSCSPIRNDSGRLVGVVLVFRDVTERKRAEQELARLYEREHRIAENLQRSLLNRPDPSLLPTLEVETLYQPAWAEAKVGGDYYDIIHLPDGKAALIVGDVSGKGLKAASKTAEMKFTLRAYLRENDNVAEAVSRLNKFVCQTQSFAEEPETFFLCLTAIVIDPSTGIAEVSVSGAEPPLIVRQDGTVDEIDTKGTPVGVFEDSDYTSVQVQLLGGDLIVVATDGITEAKRERSFLGNDGLAKLASNARKFESLAEIGNFIVDGVKQFADDKLSDDLCLLIARQK